MGNRVRVVYPWVVVWRGKSLGMGSPGEETNSIEQGIQRKQTRVGDMTFTRYTVQMQ